MQTIVAAIITIVCLVVLLELQSLDAADEVKGPKVTEKVFDNSFVLVSIANSFFKKLIAVKS